MNVEKTDELDGLSEVELLLVSMMDGCRSSVCEEIADTGWRVEVPDDYGWRHFHYPAARGQARLLEHMFMSLRGEAGQTVANMAADIAGAMPQHYAAHNGHREALVVLLSHGAAVDPRDNSGATPLHYAARGRHPSVVRTLLDHGADVNAVAKNGNTPLHEALRGYGSASEILLRRSVTVIKDPLGPTGPAVNVVVERESQDPEYAALFLVHGGADAHLRNNDGQTPLDLAEAAGLERVVGALRKKS